MRHDIFYWRLTSIVTCQWLYMFSLYIEEPNCSNTVQVHAIDIHVWNRYAYILGKHRCYKFDVKRSGHLNIWKMIFRFHFHRVSKEDSGSSTSCTTPLLFHMASCILEISENDLSLPRLFYSLHNGMYFWCKVL